MPTDLYAQLQSYGTVLETDAPHIEDAELERIITRRPRTRRRDPLPEWPGWAIALAVAVITVLVVTIPLLLFGIGGEAPPVIQPSTTTTISPDASQAQGVCGDTVQATVSLEPGVMVPSWTAETLDSTPLDLADTCGTPTWIFLFADWCEICGGNALAVFQGAFDASGDQIDFLAVDMIQPNSENLASLIGNGGYSVPVGIESGGVIEEAWSVEGIPVWVYLGADGRVVEVYHGLLEGLTATYEVAGIDISTGGIEGVVDYGAISTGHVGRDVDYPQVPPVGGPHADIWQNCGFYADEIREENAVHSLEHGVVWITYREDATSSDLDSLRALAEFDDHVLVSPYPDLPATIVASAWSRQLALESADTPRLAEFVDFFVSGPQAPEPGATCEGGVGSPE